MVRRQLMGCLFLGSVWVILGVFCLSLYNIPLPLLTFPIALLFFFPLLFCFVSQWAREGCVGVPIFHHGLAGGFHGYKGL